MFKKFICTCLVTNTVWSTVLKCQTWSTSKRQKETSKYSVAITSLHLTRAETDLFDQKFSLYAMINQTYDHNWSLLADEKIWYRPIYNN